MKMLQISILDAIEEASISSREDSLANPTQAQESEREKKTNAIYGQKCLEQFEKLNPNGLWAKTFAALLIGMEGWYSTRCNLSWKLKGTKSNRFYFQLQASTRRTEEIESGLLLTPTAVMTDESPEKMRARAEKNGYKNGTKYGSLLSQVKYGMLPTPQAIDGNGKGRPLRPKPGRKDYEKMGNWRGDLKDFATQGMLPTPTAFDYNSARTPQKWEEDKAKYKEKGINLQMPLKQMARLQMLPTPTATDCKGAYPPTSINNNEARKHMLRNVYQHIETPYHSKNSQLNPLFVEEMMGFPENWTALPFLSGETNPSRPTETQ
jgi:hypothetical protein